MQAPFSPDTVFRQSNRISSGSTIRKDGSFHRKSGSHRWQSAVADRYSQPARRYSCFGRVVQLDRADGTNSPLFTRGEWDDYGRPAAIDQAVFDQAFQRVLNGEITPTKLRKELGLSHTTFYRYRAKLLEKIEKSPDL